MRREASAIYCVRVSDFVNMAWRGDISDIDILEIRSQNLIMDASKIVYNYKCSIYVGENVCPFGICYIVQ